MKTPFFLIFPALLLSFLLHSQSCLPSGITFYTQAEVDQFPLDHPGCTAIEGEVIVQGGEVTNLDALLGVKTIGGQLFITIAYGLTSLHGLDSLASVGGNLWLLNSNLPDLNNLQNLQTVGGELWLSDSYQLTALDGLESLTTVSGNLRLTRNEKLASLAGLSQLAAIGGNIDLNDNLVLPSLHGLTALSTATGLLLTKNPALTDLTALSGLTQISGDLLVQENAALLNLQGLDHLTVVGGSLTVAGNAALTNLSGLGSLLQAAQLHLLRNPQLTDLAGLESLATVSGEVELRDNAALSTLANLSSLHAVGGNLTIAQHPQLVDLQGLAPLTTLEGDLTIETNNLLTDLAGLSNIGAFYKSVYITGNNGLTSVHGLESLDTVPENLAVHYSYQLAEVNALSNLRYVGGSFFIEGNQDLLSISPLHNLTYVGGSLEINSNYFLQTITGLESMTVLGGLSLFNNNSLKSPLGLGYVKHIPGSVAVTNNPALENLRGLDSLRTVGGGLRVDANGFGLKNLRELSALTSIGGDLYIESNAGMFSFTGMEHLTSVGGDFTVGGIVFDYQGFHHLKTIGGNVDIIGNANLGSLRGLDSLQTIGGLLGIVDNDNLPDLQGLNALTSVGDRLIIEGHYQLTTLAGLDNLHSVGGTISIRNNNALSDCALPIVCGFLNYEPDSITLTGNYGVCNEPWNLPFYCQRSPVIVSVLLDSDGDCLPDDPAVGIPDAAIHLGHPSSEGLHPTDSTGVAHFKYYNNGPFTLDLSQVSPAYWTVCPDSIQVIPAIVEDTIRAAFTLTPLAQCPDLRVELGLPANFRGCLVESQVQANVTNLGSIPATGVRVAVVIPPVFDLLTIEPPVTAQSGDTLFFNLGNLPTFATKTIRMIVKTQCDTFLLGQTLCWEAFATLTNACPTDPPPASEIKLSAQCFGDSLVRFTLKNIGDAATQATHQYSIFQNENPLYADHFALAAQQVLTLDVPADGATYRLEATKLDDGTLTATAQEHCGGLTPGLVNAFWLDQGPLAYDLDCRQVVGAFDPNLKSAVPTGAGSYRLLVPNRLLQYTIDFQNTGTDTAYQVLLQDYLPYELDLRTFHPEAASHPYTWDIRGYILRVLFHPIALPDSNANEPASHGFFSFTIDQKPDLPDGSILENAASIIFDFNPPIVTNTVRHIIGQLTVSVAETQPYANLWKVWGNPLRDMATFRTETFIGGKKRFELFDAGGMLVCQAGFNGQSFDFQRDGLPVGLYFFKIQDALGRVFAGKIVVAE